MLGTGQLDWRDLTPIHKQLWDGTPAKSGHPWGEKLPRSVAKDVIGDYEATQFWLAIGLGTLAAAAFIFSEIATGGMATFLWAAAGTAASGTQAAISIEKYETLSAAASTATSEDTRLVSQEQVDEARVAAVLDTAFAFLDVYGAAKGIGKAVQATAARKGLEGLAKASGPEAAQAVQNAVRELGAHETIRRSAPKTVEELVELAGGETSEAGKALRTAAEDATMAPQAARVAGEAAAPTAAARKLAGAAASVFERWSSLSRSDRLRELVKIVNEELAKIGCPPLEPVVRLEKGGGQLTFQQRMRDRLAPALQRLVEERRDDPHGLLRRLQQVGVADVGELVEPRPLRHRVDDVARREAGRRQVGRGHDVPRPVGEEDRAADRARQVLDVHALHRQAGLPDGVARVDRHDRVDALEDAGVAPR